MVNHIENLKLINVEHPSALNSAMKVLVSKEQGWDGYVMRLVEVEVGGYTPKHSHPWPHINFMVEGNGALMIEGVDNPVKQGSYAFVPGGALHQFKNTGTDVFKFICIVPEEGHKI